MNVGRARLRRDSACGSFLSSRQEMPDAYGWDRASDQGTKTVCDAVAALVPHAFAAVSRSV